MARTARGSVVIPDPQVTIRRKVHAIDSMKRARYSYCSHGLEFGFVHENGPVPCKVQYSMQFEPM